MDSLSIFGNHIRSSVGLLSIIQSVRLAYVVFPSGRANDTRRRSFQDGPRGRSGAHPSRQGETKYAPIPPSLATHI